MSDRASKRRQRKNSSKVRKALPKLNGRTVKNPSEFDCYNKILDMLPPKASIVYEADRINYSIEGKYLIDYTVDLPDGRTLMIEYKGAGRAWDQKVRQKMIAARDQNPDLDIKIVFHRDAEFGAARKDGTKQRQSDWARRNGFDFCIGAENIPEEWFE
jgi:hypothetical protein